MGWITFANNSNGTDWMGIAAFVTSIATMFGVIGSIWLGIKSGKKADEAATAIDHAKKMAMAMHVSITKDLSEAQATVDKTQLAVTEVEKQTNSRLSLLDAEIKEHRVRCVESKAEVAQLKALLAEALSKVRNIN